MAYSGTDREDRTNAQIGFAVAETPTGEWTKVGTQPIVSFDSSEWDSVGLTYYPGAIEPSLVSFDEGGLAVLRGIGSIQIELCLRIGLLRSRQYRPRRPQGYRTDGD